MARKAIPKKVGDADQKPPLEGSYIPPNQPLNFGKLNLDRTKLYVDKINSMSENEAMELLNKGIQAKLMLMNDQILKQLEILDGLEDPRERLAALATIEKLTAATSAITENKIKLDKSLGLHLPGTVLPRENDAPIGEMSEADFIKQFAPKLLSDDSLVIPTILDN